MWRGTVLHAAHLVGKFGAVFPVARRALNSSRGTCPVMAKGKDAPLPQCACPPPRQHRACDPRPSRALGTPVPGFPQRAVASLRVSGALSLRARARAQ